MVTGNKTGIKVDTPSRLSAVKMKRAEEQDDMFESKRPRLDEAVRPCYSVEPARLVSDWDDDELDCALEEVCIIAELSQRPSNACKAEPSNGNQHEELSESSRLLDKLKTKDGEVAILRSQLQQQVAMKNSESSNHRRAMDEMEKKYKFNYMEVTKNLERLMGELEFKDLEVKGLKEKCKQLEMKYPATNFPQPSNLFSLSQTMGPKRSKDYAEKLGRQSPGQQVKVIHEGDKLSRLIPHSYFSKFDEPSVMSMYPTTSFQRDEFDHARDGKYKWVGLPKSESHLGSCLPCVIKLIQSETFLNTHLDCLAENATKILRNLAQTLEFLSKLPRDQKNESKMMKNESPGESWSLDRLRTFSSGDTREQGIEARMILGIISAVCRAGPASISSLVTKEFMRLLLKVVELIGKCRRSYDYAGFFIATLYFFQAFLSNRGKGEIEEEIMDLVKQTIGEIILSRSKLDVIKEILRTFAAGVHLSNFVSCMCKRSAASDCALYIDPRLQQAILFTRDVCPLKLLQIQVKTLSFLCKSKDHFLEILTVYTSWLRCLVNSSRKPQIWLFADRDNCCDMLESFAYLLYLCTAHLRFDQDYKRTFEAGISALRNCLKGHKRKFRLSTVKLLGSSLKSSGLLNVISPEVRKNAQFVINEIEVSSQNSSLQHNSSYNQTLRRSVTTS